MKKFILFFIISGSLWGQGRPLDTESVNNQLSVPIVNRIMPMRSDHSGQSEKIFGSEYFPLDYSRLYYFDSNAGDTQAQIDTIGRERILSFDASGIRYSQKLDIKSDGIYLTRTESKAFLFFGSKVYYPEPALRLPLPLKLGDTWRWQGLETSGSDTSLLTIEGEVLAEELIFTPAGQFLCLKVQQKVETVGGSSSIVTEWLAPNIGIVKSHSVLEGKGFTGLVQKVFGLDEITFELARVEAVPQ